MARKNIWECDAEFCPNHVVLGEDPELPGVSQILQSSDPAAQWIGVQSGYGRARRDWIFCSWACLASQAEAMAGREVAARE